MSAITIDKFETKQADEYGEAFGLIDLEPATMSYGLGTDEYSFAIGFSDGEWVCEIGDADGDCMGCYQGDTPERALENAAVDAFATRSMRENDNCEDAVNQIAYSAYGMLNDCEYPDTDEEYEQLDRMFGTARDIVRRHGSTFGIEWVEF